MLGFIRLRCHKIFPGLCNLRVSLRYASSKKKSVAPPTSALRHNWLEMSSEISPSDASQLPTVPDTTFNLQLLQYLSNATKQPLTAQVHQHLMNSFQSWSPREFYDLISILGAYGLQPMDVLRLLVELPSSDKTIVNVSNFKKCFEGLLQLQFDTTTRSILISNDPDLLQYDLTYLRERFDVLHCYFTKREISKLVRTHKKLFSEKWSDLDYKINYLKTMLFASTRDIVESGALAHSIDHIRQRYLFVYRAGLFKRVRREEHYFPQRELNISLLDIFHASLSTFLKRTTNNLLRPDDYQAFVDSLRNESFDEEFERYLTLDKTRKKWSSADMYLERRERRHWMGEFDMFDEQIDESDEQSLVIAATDEKKSVARLDTEPKPSEWHVLSDWNPDRHRRRKIRENVDPNIRL